MPAFYEPAGCAASPTPAARRRLPLWSNDPPDEAYPAVLGGGLRRRAAEVVSFPNPLQDRDATNTVYLAR